MRSERVEECDERWWGCAAFLPRPTHSGIKDGADRFVVADLQGRMTAVGPLLEVLPSVENTIAP